MPCPNYRRKRTISKAFRVSHEENERIELLSKAAGVTQQQYIMMKLEDKEFTIVPDVRTYKMLRDEMRSVYSELCRIRDGSGINEQLEAKIVLLSELFAGLNDVGTESPLQQADDLISDMERR